MEFVSNFVEIQTKDEMAEWMGPLPFSPIVKITPAFISITKTNIDIAQSPALKISWFCTSMGGVGQFYHKDGVIIELVISVIQ